MSGTIINFEERRRNAQIKKAGNVRDLRANFQSRSVHDDIPRKEVSAVALSRYEFRTLLLECNRALADGLIKDYAAPMSTTARPVFAFKSRTQDPDLMSMEKAKTDEGTIYIVRKRGKTPEINGSFEQSMDSIRGEFDRLRAKKQIQLVQDTAAPEPL